LAPGDRLQLEPQALDAAHQVRGQHNRAGLREMPVDLLRDTFHARAAGDEMVERPAFGACLRLRLGMAAMVADELAAETMLDQPARAFGTLKTMAAHAAERQRRITAAV